MISAETTRRIVECARAFGAKAVWLFGSSLSEGDRARDIDIAVEGVPADRVFDLYVRLDQLFSKPVDLVDLSAPLSIVPLVRATGVRIYERKKALPSKRSRGHRQG
jgi:predicted nucleotidyltransferase